MRRASRTAVVPLVVLALAATAAGSVVPAPVANAVHGRVIGWARTGAGWFAVYVDRSGGDWCGLRNASWRMALVAGNAPPRVVYDAKVSDAMCGNELAWVRAGRFSDGRHRDVAFMLWTTPSIGAHAYVYRVQGTRLVRLAVFAGDKVTLARGSATVAFENRGRSPHGELEQVWKFTGGRYRLVARR